MVALNSGPANAAAADAESEVRLREHRRG